MTLDLSAPLPATSQMPQTGPGGLPQKTAADYPTKFEEVAPGSTILVTVRGGDVEPFQAIVLDTMLEYGPTGIPALHVMRTEDQEPFIIPASGMFSITVLVDAHQIAASMPIPVNGIKVRTIVHLAEAIQFKGGIESASEIVQWAIGKTTFRYVTGTDEVSDHLLQSGVNGGTVWPGDWIVKLLDTGRFTIVDQKLFATEYEETA